MAVFRENATGWHQYSLTPKAIGLKPSKIGLTPKLNTPNAYHPLETKKMQVDMDDVEYITETTLTIRGTRRRTTMPKVIVDRFSLKNGDKVRWILLKDGRILLSKVK